MIFVAFPLLLLIFFLVFNLCQFDKCVLGCFSLDLSCVGLCDFWTWVAISFPVLTKFLTIISSNTFSEPFFFSSSVTPIIQMLMCLMLFQESLRWFSLFSFFFLYSFYSSDFHHSIFQLTYPLFILLFCYQYIIFFKISVIVLFNSVYSFFQSFCC